MAEAGSFAEKVKNQADIVRVVGEYVRLKKSGANFMGLCPFHSEKTPSFAVHPVKQIYHCFGCGVGGDVFSFVMAMEKCEFREALNTVAEKCSIPIPRMRERSPEERRGDQQRTALVEMHRQAAAFFTEQLHSTPEGRAARAYLEDRGLDREAIAYFGLGYAPSAGDALLRVLRAKFPQKLLEASGLVGRDPGGRLYDRFRRRILFPIADLRGRVIAFGGRALGDDLPKYLNSPETPIYKKSEILYNGDRAKDAIRERGYAVLVEGYMDAISVARAGITNVVASCGTSLTAEQIKLLRRFSEGRVVVNYDPDAAGQVATERSLALLLEHNFDVRVLVLPGGGDKGAADPDLFIRTQGAEAYHKLLSKAPPYVDYLIGRTRRMDLATAEGKLRAVNFLMPYVQRVPDRLLRSEWATRIAQQLGIDEPVLRESLRKAAAERRSEVKPKPELLGAHVKPAERRLIQMLVEAGSFRTKLARAIAKEELHTGLETQKIFGALLEACGEGQLPDPAAVADHLEEKDRRLLFEIVFEPASEATWEEAESCLGVLRRRHVEAELVAVQKQIEAKPNGAELRKLLARKQALCKQLAELAGD
jgi:DNA primase